MSHVRVPAVDYNYLVTSENVLPTWIPMYFTPGVAAIISSRCLHHCLNTFIITANFHHC